MRMVCQETFKGYGKGLSLITLINKGFKLDISIYYFIVLLVIRGSVSAVFKEAYMSLIFKKPMKFYKAKLNFIYITIPALILFMLL